MLLKTLKSFGPALKGIRTGFITENNLMVHLIIGCIVIVAGVVLNIQKHDWLWILICIGMVFTVEYLNTAIEKLTDLASPQYNDLAGKVKNLSAAAVLIICITAAVIGLVVFVPYFV